jgi:uncharacterized membrane protein
MGRLVELLCSNTCPIPALGKMSFTITNRVGSERVGANAALLLFVALLKFLGVTWFDVLVCILFLIAFFIYMSMDSAISRRKAQELAVEKQQAEENKKAERAKQEAIADAEWNARFV